MLLTFIQCDSLQTYKELYWILEKKWHIYIWSPPLFGFCNDGMLEISNDDYFNLRKDEVFNRLIDEYTNNKKILKILSEL